TGGHARGGGGAADGGDVPGAAGGGGSRGHRDAVDFPAGAVVHGGLGRHSEQRARQRGAGDLRGERASAAYRRGAGAACTRRGGGRLVDGGDRGVRGAAAPGSDGGG